MPPKEEPKDNDGKEGKSALEEELNLIGGKELVLARMELDTSQNHLKEKIKENKTLMKACEELKSHLETQKAEKSDGCAACSCSCLRIKKGDYAHLSSSAT